MAQDERVRQSLTVLRTFCGLCVINWSGVPYLVVDWGHVAGVSREPVSA